MSKVSPFPKNLNPEQVRQSLELVLNANPKSPKRTISDLSRVNEQQIYAALLHSQIAHKSLDDAKSFLEKFGQTLAEKKTGDHLFFDAARGAINSLRAAGKLGKRLVSRISKYALGKAQLDSNRQLLSTSNVSAKPGDTALRAVKTALNKFASNTQASQAEFKEFKFNNQLRKSSGDGVKVG